MADRQSNDNGQGNMRNSQHDGRQNDSRGGFGARSGRDRDMRDDDRSMDRSSRR